MQALQDEMDRVAVEHMSKNQMEQKVILENMRVQASEISARQAAEVVENSAKARDKVIEDAKKTRDEKLQRLFVSVMKIKRLLLMKRMQSLRKQNVNMIVQFPQQGISIRKLLVKQNLKLGNMQTK